MKIFIDPVYTGKAHKCSTSFLAWELIEGLSKWRDDCFFYLLYPKAAEKNEEEMAFLSRMPERVTLFPYPYLQSDRLEEAFKLHEDMIHLLSPGDTPIWDVDVVVTSRISMLPFMRNMHGREVNFRHGTHRLFVGMECMPIFAFRDTVAWGAGGHNDLPSLAAYQSAGAIMINDLWTKGEVLKAARKWLSPSTVIELSKAIHEVLPVHLQRLKTDSYKPLEDVLNVVFAGRMTGTRSFDEVAEIFRKHDSYPLGKNGKQLKFIVSTNSLSTGSADVGDIKFMDIQYNNRQKFHALLQEKAHVVVNLSKIEDFSLSTYEPLLFGVPVIVSKYPWTNFLGKNYPFRAENNDEAYALVKMFAEDYEGQMAKFKAWEETTWKDLVDGPRNKSMLEGLIPIIEDHTEALKDKILKKTDGGGFWMTLVKAIKESNIQEIDVLAFAKDQGAFTTNSKVFKGIPIGKRANPYLLKVYLEAEGYRDTNKPGVMIAP